MRLRPVSLPVTCSLAVFLLGLSAGNAHAYLDAGTGSMLLQILLGGFAGLAIAGKLYWHKFLTVIGVRRDSGEEKPAVEKAARSHETTSR